MLVGNPQDFPLLFDDGICCALAGLWEGSQGRNPIGADVKESRQILERAL
jgi:hypothetical protein